VKTDGRMDRLEVKVDSIKDDVSELKADFRVHVSKMDTRMEVFADHIQGDNKIINEIQPLIEQLPKMAKIVKEYEYKKTRNKKLMQGLGVVAVIVGILSGLAKLGLF
tara:strand:- start:5267 stop:5587 length:321 start_codon:yes stop_codon:yes gene_type:complete